MNNMNECNCDQSIELKKENEQLKSRIEELEMVEQKYSKYIHKAWYVIEEAAYENHDSDLKKFMQGE